MQKAVSRIEEFLDAAYVRSHSEETVKTYRNCIKKFEKFCKEKYDCYLEEIILEIKAKRQDVYEVIRDFVIWQDKLDYQPRTIDLAANAAKSFLRHCGIRIYSEDFKQVVRLPRKIKTQEVPLTKEILLRLQRNVSPKLQTVILVLVSSGMRIGELVQLTIDDINFDSKPTKIRIRAETTKTRTQRDTFITTEATIALKDYLKRYHGWIDGEQNVHLRNIPIFGRTSISTGKLRDNNKLKTSKVLASKCLLQKTLEKGIEKVPGLAIKNEDGRNVIHFHNFRKFFRTVVGNVCGRDYAEALIGHTSSMDTYYNLSEEKKQKMYLDAEPYLTISDFKTVEKNCEALSERCRQLEETVENLKKYTSTKSVEVPAFIKDG